MPEGMEYIWHWYLEVHGGDKLSFSELKAWSELTRIRLKTWEVDLIKMLDNIRWSALRD